MSTMISVASGFQYSVNIGYDLNNDDKLKNFIPTKSALSLLEEILLSTNVNSTNRARVLIGAYGKGKSHIVLMILSMLMKKDINLFSKLLPLLQENPRLNQCVQIITIAKTRFFPSLLLAATQACRRPSCWHYNGLWQKTTCLILCQRPIIRLLLLLLTDGKTNSPLLMINCKQPSPNLFPFS